MKDNFIKTGDLLPMSDIKADTNNLRYDNNIIKVGDKLPPTTKTKLTNMEI